MKLLPHLAVVTAMALVAGLAWIVAAPLAWPGPPPGQAPALQAPGATVPIFEYDPTFPKPMKETWAIGPIGGMAVDRQDHLYVVQRPGSLASNERFTGSDDTPPKADCCIPAPAVLEFESAPQCQEKHLVKVAGPGGAGDRAGGANHVWELGRPLEGLARPHRKAGDQPQPLDAERLGDQLVLQTDIVVDRDLREAAALHGRRTVARRR